MYFFVALALVSFASASNWDTYPSVPKTATINGFSDPIKDLLPECAAECADFSTSNTPCPYWDTGCLCVMPQWSGQVASCIVKSCSGSELALATSLCYSLCSSVGANVWMMPASLSTELSEAGEGYNVAAASTTFTSSESTGKSDASITEVLESTATSANGSDSSSSGSSDSKSSAASTSSATSSSNGSYKNSGSILSGLFAAVLFMLH